MTDNEQIEQLAARVDDLERQIRGKDEEIEALKEKVAYAEDALSRITDLARDAWQKM